MSEKNYSFKLKEDWNKKKYLSQDTPEYVYNYLHHEGLLCLRNHEWYYLRPENEGDKFLPDQLGANQIADVRLFWVEDPLSPETQDNPCATLSENILTNKTSDFDYSVIFLKNFEIFHTRQRIKIYWDRVPSQFHVGRETEEEEFTEEEKEVGYEIPIGSSSITPDIIARRVRQIKTGYFEKKKLPPVKICNRVDGLVYIHLPEDDAKLLERCNAFLLIRDMLFFMSPLYTILDHASETIPIDYFRKN